MAVSPGASTLHSSISSFRLGSDDGPVARKLLARPPLDALRPLVATIRVERAARCVGDCTRRSDAQAARRSFGACSMSWPTRRRCTTWRAGAASSSSIRGRPMRIWPRGGVLARSSSAALCGRTVCANKCTDRRSDAAAAGDLELRKSACSPNAIDEPCARCAESAGHRRRRTHEMSAGVSDERYWAPNAHEASGEQRKRIEAAASSAVPGRPRGMSGTCVGPVEAEGLRPGMPRAIFLPPTSIVAPSSFAAVKRVRM